MIRSAGVTRLFQRRTMAAIVAAKGTTTAPRLANFSARLISCIESKVPGVGCHIFALNNDRNPYSWHLDDNFRRIRAKSPGSRAVAWPAGPRRRPDRERDPRDH